MNFESIFLNHFFVAISASLIVNSFSLMIDQVDLIFISHSLWFVFDSKNGSHNFGSMHVNFLQCKSFENIFYENGSFWFR